MGGGNAGGSSSTALLAFSQGGDAVGAAARHRSVGSLGTQPPRRSEAPNQGRVICAAAIASSLHLVGQSRSWIFRMARAPQVSEALFILREAANGLRVVHGHQVRLPGADLGFHGIYSPLCVAIPRPQVDCFWADCSSRRQGAQYSAQRNAWLLSNVHLRLRCAVQLELSRAAVGSEANLSAGVARVENLVDTVSKTGFKGTPAFMSPEQLQVSAGSRAVA